MGFSQILSCGLLIILVCWLSVNDAIPLGSDPELEVIQTTTVQPNTEFSETVPITVQPIVTSTAKSDNGKAYGSIDSVNHSPDVNQHDVMKNDEEQTQVHQVRQKGRQSRVEVFDIDNNDQKIDISNAYSSLKSHDKDFEEKENPLNKVQLKSKCVNEERRQNQTYTRSIPLNTSSINPDEDFKIPGEPEAKKTSSVHIGEDIALCWIETTTIKEDNFFYPPKRLVIREFTISFENSASIPDSYLECNDIEGEIAPGDEDTIRNTDLHEIIDENSKRSREVNFTHVSTVGRIIVRQHKKVKCGVGAVVSKDIFEWPDGTDNPKKRIEIKVGPSIRDIRSIPNSKSAECTTESVEKKTQTENNRTSSSTSSDETSASCENGDCSATVTSCEGDCSSKSLSEQTTYPPDSNELLSTGVTEATTTTQPKGTNLSMPLHQNSDRHRDELCSEFDTVCMSSQSTTVEPQRVNETFESCSGENCLEGSFEGTNSDLPCEQNSDASCSCSGDDCGTNQNTTGSTEDSAQITILDGELCKNGSESCICNGSSCFTQNSKETKFLESESKRTNVSLNETSTKTLAKLTHGILSSHMDSKCNGEVGNCSETNVPTRFNSDEEKNGKGTVELTSFDKNLNTGASTEQIGTTEIIEVTEATKIPGEIDDTPGIGNVSSCNRSGFGNCSTITSDDTILMNAFSNDTEEHFSSIEVNSSREISKEQLQSLSLNSDEIRSSSTCSESDEGCTTVQPNRKFVSPPNSTNMMPDTKAGSWETETISPTSEQSIPITTIRFSDDEIEISTTSNYQEIDRFNEGMIGSVFKNSTNRETSTKKSTTDPIATDPALHETLSSEKRSVTDCSADSENSSGCVQQTTTHPPNLANVSTVPSVLGASTLPTKSCDSSENCESIDSSSRSDEINDRSAGEAQGQTEMESSCENGDESCQDLSSASKSTETCDDGSTNCKSESIESISEPCDSASGSCSSETNESETHRSEIMTTPLSTSVKKRHRLALKIKVLLEHIDENKENQKLVQVEKHLLLNENSSDHGNHSLMWQLQALNNSINLETLKAIFNCSALKNLSANEIDLDKLSKDVINDDINNLKEVRQKTEKLYSNKTTEIRPEENSGSSIANDDNQYNFNHNTNVALNNRKKREISSPLDITTEVENDIGSTTVVSAENDTDSTTVVSVENVTDSTTVVSVENDTDSTTIISVENGTDFTTQKSILQSLPGVEEDLTSGMNHILSLISKETGDFTTDDVNTTPSALSSKILKILSDPSDNRVHFASLEIIPRIKRAVTVQQLTTPVHGEEIERWSKERFVSAAGGGQIRRLTEFRILRENSEDS